MPNKDAFSAEEMSVLRPIFVDSARQHLSAIAAAAEALDETCPDAAWLETLHRSIHSVKGAALQLGFETLGHSAARFEQVLLRVRNAQEETPDGWLELTRRALPFLARAIDRISAGEGEEPDEIWAAALEEWLARPGRGWRRQVG